MAVSRLVAVILVLHAQARTCCEKDFDICKEKKKKRKPTKRIARNHNLGVKIQTTFPVYPHTKTISFLGDYMILNPHIVGSLRFVY